MKRKNEDNFSGDEELFKMQVSDLEFADYLYSLGKYTRAYNLIEEIVLTDRYTRNYEDVHNDEVACAYLDYKATMSLFHSSVPLRPRKVPPTHDVPKMFDIPIRSATYCYYLKHTDLYSNNRDVSLFGNFLSNDYDRVLEKEACAIIEQNLTDCVGTFYAITAFVRSLFVSGAFRTYPRTLDFIERVSSYQERYWFALQYAVHCGDVDQRCEKMIDSQNSMEKFGLSKLKSFWIHRVGDLDVVLDSFGPPIYSLLETAFEQAVRTGKITLSESPEENIAEYDVLSRCEFKQWNSGLCERCNKFAIWRHTRYGQRLADATKVPYGKKPTIFTEKILACKYC